MGPGPVLGAALFVLPALLRLARVAAVLRSRRALPRASATPLRPTSSLVSVLVPARNEQRGIEACLASLSAQTYPVLEILAIDDGSTDRTPALLAAATRRDRRVRVIRLEGPPAGWTGKCFALASGAAVARGRWLCFTDADTVHAPESIARAVAFAEAHGLALLSLTSRQVTGSFWERVVQPVVFGLLDQWYPLDRVSDPASPLAAANGIFLLVARDAYEAVGGHRAVAGEVVEDVALARAVKGAGHRIAFVDGADLVAARMYTGFGALRLGWVKNLHRLRGRRALPVLATAAELLTTVVWPTAGGLAAALVAPAALAGPAALGALLGLLAEAWFRARRGEDWRWSPSAPLGAVVVTAFLLESAARDWLGLGVRWKDRRYT